MEVIRPRQDDSAHTQAVKDAYAQDLGPGQDILTTSACRKLGLL